MIVGRRSVVAGCAALLSGLGGCLSSENVSDVYVVNESEDAITATLRVVRTEDSTELLAETIQLEADGSKTYDEVVGESTAEATFDVENGPSKRFEWSDSDDDSITLQIRFDAESIEFSIVSGLL